MTLNDDTSARPVVTKACVALSSSRQIYIRALIVLLSSHISDQHLGVSVACKDNGILLKQIAQTQLVAPWMDVLEKPATNA